MSVRKQIDISLTEAIAPVDAASRLGIRVVFTATSSLEGMYYDEKKTMVLSSMRPAGRRSYTCAHEIGHWYFGHGTSVDQLVDSLATVEQSTEERLANAFASYFLMPPRAVLLALKERGWSAPELTPERLFILATQLGVGYSTLLGHLRFTMNRLDPKTYEQLRATTPKQIRERLTEGAACPHLVVVDGHWAQTPVDLEVGDAISVPVNATLSRTLVSRPTSIATDAGDMISVAQRPGLGEIRMSDRTVPLRVSPRKFVGHARNRFLDPEEDVHEVTSPGH